MTHPPIYCAQINVATRAPLAANSLLRAFAPKPLFFDNGSMMSSEACGPLAAMSSISPLGDLQPKIEQNVCVKTESPGPYMDVGTQTEAFCWLPQVHFEFSLQPVIVFDQTYAAVQQLSGETVTLPLATLGCVFAPGPLRFQGPPQPFHPQMTYHAGGATAPKVFDKNVPQGHAAYFPHHPYVSLPASRPQPQRQAHPRSSLQNRRRVVRPLQQEY